MKKMFIGMNLKLNEMDSPTILKSESFLTLLQDYLKKLQDSHSHLYFLLEKTFKNDIVIAILELFQALYNGKKLDSFQNLQPLLQNKEMLLELIDGLYDAWRGEERYLFLEYQNENSVKDLLNDVDTISTLVIKLYRQIYENVLNSTQQIYRQLPSGVNVGFLLNKRLLDVPSKFKLLQNNSIIESMVIKPPFMVSTSSNKRVGYFKESSLQLSQEELESATKFKVISVLINGHTGLIYLNDSYLSFAVGIGTLFQMATPADLESHLPEFILFFGLQSSIIAPYYYKDESGTYIGVVPNNPSNDYFGYMKKMILTLHNLAVIDRKALPIHGAGILLTLKSGMKKFVVLLGDSGAGKSETIEAMKALNSPSIVDMSIVFDDMGQFEDIDNEIYASGTEIGAFVRLDDLDKGYSLKSIDRAVYYNADLDNARLVVPLTPYHDVIKKYHVDYFMLANNYIDNPLGVVPFTSLDEALAEFKLASRRAISSTSETGIVTTFFANPFGVLQKKEEAEPLINQFLKTLYDNGEYLGTLYTRLTLPLSNPVLSSARALIKLLEELEELKE